MDFNVNVNVKFDATPELTGVVSTLVGTLRPTGVAQPIQVGTVAETTIQGPGVSEQPGIPVATPGPVVAEQPKEITDEQLRAFMGPKSKEKGKDAIFAILDEFGVKRVPDLKQEQRQAFIDKVNAL